jgi:hypothetical protein
MGVIGIPILHCTPSVVSTLPARALLQSCKELELQGLNHSSDSGRRSTPVNNELREVKWSRVELIA